MSELTKNKVTEFDELRKLVHSMLAMYDHLAVACLFLRDVRSPLSARPLRNLSKLNKVWYGDCKLIKLLPTMRESLFLALRSLR